MMEFTAEMIAGFLGGDIVGDKQATVHTVSSIEEGKAGSLAYLTNPKYEPFLYTTQASIVLVNRSFTPSQPVAATLIRVDDAGACVLKLLEMYNAAKPRKEGISRLASIAESARVGEKCYIGDFTVVERGVEIGAGCQIYPQVYLGDGVRIGEGTILYPGVKIYEGCVVGRNCILHAVRHGEQITPHMMASKISYEGWISKWCDGYRLVEKHTRRVDIALEFGAEAIPEARPYEIRHSSPGLAVATA